MSRRLVAVTTAIVSVLWIAAITYMFGWVDAWTITVGGLR